MKRARALQRDRRAWMSQYVLPACVVAAALGAAQALQPSLDEPPLELGLRTYGGETPVIPAPANHYNRARLKAGGGSEVHVCVCVANESLWSR